MSNFSIKYNYRLINNFSAAAKEIKRNVDNINKSISESKASSGVFTKQEKEMHKAYQSYAKMQQNIKNFTNRDFNVLPGGQKLKYRQALEDTKKMTASYFSDEQEMRQRLFRAKQEGQERFNNYTRKQAQDEAKIAKQKQKELDKIAKAEKSANDIMINAREKQAKQIEDITRQSLYRQQQNQQRLAVTSIRAGMLATQVGQIATLGLTVPIVGAFAVGFDFFTKSEKFQIGLKTFLNGNKKLAKDMYSEIFQFAALTPFEFEETQKTALSILAQTPEIGSKGLQSKFMELGTLSAMFNTPIAGVADVYAQISAGDKLQARQLMRLRNKNIPFIKYAAEAFMIDTPNVKQNLQDAKNAVQNAISNGQFGKKEFDRVLAYIKEKAPDAIKDLEVSTSGRIAVFKDMTAAIFGNFAETTLKALKFDKIMTSINEKMGNLVAKIFAGEKGFTKFDAIAMGVLASIGPIYMMAGKAFDMIGNFSLAMIGLRLFKQNKWLMLITGGLKFLGVLGLVLFSIEAIRLAFSFLPDWDKFFPQDKKLAKFAKDTTSLWKNTLTGAAIGAGIGSMFGGIGAIPGALIGATIALVSTGLSQLYASLSEYQWFDDLKSWFAETHKLTVSIWASMPEWLKNFLRIFDLVTPLLGLNKSNEKNPYGYAMLPKFDTTENEKKLYTQYSDQFGLEKTKKALSLGGFFPIETENYKQYSTNSGMLSPIISKQNSLNIKIETEKGLKASSDKKDNGSLSWLGLEIGDYKSDKYGYGV